MSLQASKLLVTEGGGGWEGAEPGWGRHTIYKIKKAIDVSF